jgi:5-hydroxyisourate hydrolase
MSNYRSRVTTHVLDASLGRPAAGVVTMLEQRALSDWLRVADGVTDGDGRIEDFGPVDLDAGVYRVTFDTGTYFRDTAQTGFYPEVTISFTMGAGPEHYHVPLLLSPYAYSTYRGS